jgi:hypothetical protein
MQIRKLLTTINLFDRIKEFRENWFPWIVILVGTSTYSISIMSVTQAVARNHVAAIWLERIGTAWLLFGALWTALGAHLSAKDKASLDRMAAQGALEVDEIVRMFKAASNFATFGAFMIMLGTAVLLYKSWMY